MTGQDLIVAGLQSVQWNYAQQQAQWQNQTWITPNFLYNYAGSGTFEEKKPKTFRQELQDDVDVWLKDVA